MKKDIAILDDIRLMVDTFYGKVREDETLKDIFNNEVQDRWPAHLEKLVNFWQTVLLDKHTYYGSPFLPHTKLPIDKNHFDQWLMLFFETVDENFEGKKADEAKWRAQKMAEMFMYKLNINSLKN